MRLAIAAVLLCGCSFEASFDEGYRCVPDLPCPDGTACVDGFCRSGPAGDAGGGDANGGGPPDATPPYACPGVPILVETFDDTIDQAVWDLTSEGGASAAAMGGQLRIVPSGPSSSAGILSDDPYDTTPASIAIEVFDPDETNENFQALELMNSGVAVVSMNRYRGTLRVQLNNGGQTLDEVEWNGTAHHAWRITITGNNLVFETGPQLGVWTELVSGAGVGLGVTRVKLTAGNYENEDPPELGFDNLYLCPLD
ncbi:MAG TPA: hypothetical protein VMZ28_30315 [Kofleriaceae bacterium]|nr:hypothetical protein [Kofleriaceae bacterium]